MIHRPVVSFALKGKDDILDAEGGEPGSCRGFESHRACETSVQFLEPLFGDLNDECALRGIMPVKCGVADLNRLGQFAERETNLPLLLNDFQCLLHGGHLQVTVMVGPFHRKQLIWKRRVDNGNMHVTNGDMKKVLILNGHPDPQSLCAALAHAYAQGANSRGCQAQVLNVLDLKFDPVLHRGYKVSQVLEPDLVRAQQSILWADHVVVVFPIWWSSIPALFKGFFDRILLPGFAFQYKKGGLLWDKLLSGRTGEVLLTTDAPKWWNRWILKDPAINMMKQGVLEFCGIRVKRVTSFASVKSQKPGQIAKFLRKAEKLGAGLRGGRRRRQRCGHSVGNTPVKKCSTAEDGASSGFQGTGWMVSASDRAEMAKVPAGD